MNKFWKDFIDGQNYFHIDSNREGLLFLKFCDKYNVRYLNDMLEVPFVGGHVILQGSAHVQYALPSYNGNLKRYCINFCKVLQQEETNILEWGE